MGLHHVDRRAADLADGIADAPADALLSRQQLADYLGVSVFTVKRWDRMGTGPRSVRAGLRAIRYRKDDVLRWLEACAARRTA